MQLEFIDRKLRRMATWAEDQTGLEFTLTSQFRINDPGVHGQLPLRGIDWRMRNKAVGNAIVDLINAEWKYDSSRPHLRCAKLHNTGQGLHIHLQVHQKTTGALR